MTMLEHQLLGTVILFALFHFVFKPYFYTKKDMQEIEDEVNHWMK
jgi:hypothetical protein